MLNPPKQIFLVGEAMGEAEARLKVPFVGPSGAELIRMLGESGILALTRLDRDLIHKFYTTQDSRSLETLWSLHPNVFRTNVFQLHPPGNDLLHFCGPKADSLPGYPALLKSKYVRREFEPELERLTAEILERDPNIIICLGNTPLWALAGRVGIKKWRGTTLLSTHTVTDYKLLPTYHPAYVLRDYPTRPTVIADLSKALAQSHFPELRRPPREIWIEPSLDDITRFIAENVKSCELLSVDIETSGSRITCIGLSPRPDLAIVIPFDDDRAKDGNYWPTGEAERACWETLRSVLGDPSIPKLFQNGLYDIAFLWRSVRVKVLGATHDTMLLHHALQPEALKALDFLGSIYSDEGAWKAEYRGKRRTIKRDA